jgi:hypothetical protein
MFKPKEVISFTLVIMLLVFGSSGQELDQPILTAELPLHLEEHIDDARIEGSEVGEDRQEMVDVGDHKLRIVRSGQGRPTVVFKSGLGGTEIGRWHEILARIGEITSAVCYARAGRAGSEPAKGPRTPTAITEELHTMLERAGYKPPYILVGASFGALYVRVFAMRYPKDVAGLVLIDGVHERSRAASYMAKMADEKDIASLERIGMADYFISGDLGVFSKLPDVPMVVMTSTRSKSVDYRKVWRDLHSELFQATSNGMHIVTDRAGHAIYIDDPDLVVNAIRWMIDAVRKEKSMAESASLSNKPQSGESYS